jgi:hypothetical protein
MDDWDLVSEAFDSDHDECASCEHYFYQYWSDTGVEVSCGLLDGDKGSPVNCPAFAEMKERTDDE